jgi:hypothetical protein
MHPSLSSFVQTDDPETRSPFDRVFILAAMPGFRAAKRPLHELDRNAAQRAEVAVHGVAFGGKNNARE